MALGVSMYSRNGFAVETNVSCQNKVYRVALAHAQAHFNLEKLIYEGAENFGNVYRFDFHYRNCAVYADVTVGAACQVLGVALGNESAGGNEDPFCE
jgi:hypothetical protein